MDKKQQILQQYFGYASFREGQAELIDVITGGRDAVGIMPTGAGKSLCFQIPALLMPGISLVISPLISLMKDQVAALNQSGVRAAYLNSSLTQAQYRAAMRNAREGVYKIIYVAPERLMTDSFLEFAKEADLNLITIDEAHCVSQWGQDFRPGYLDIPRFVEALPRRPVVCAFTATATPKVREDVISLLELRDPYVMLTSFDRKNLFFSVLKPKSKDEALLRLLKGLTDKSGIIYCSTRKSVDAVWELLCRSGYAAARYHAGLPDRERRDSQDGFLWDQSPVMVATNAFGMGIDKSNVAFVIHYNMPKDLESYYQEAGRAGRDGEPAECILLYGGQDVITNQFLLDHGDEKESLDPETAALVKERGRERLKAMTFYCHTTGCLRAYILRYFGETAPAFCDNCHNCRHGVETVDITIPAQMILSCVRRLGERFGIKLVVDVLRGSEQERIRQLRLDTQSTYGLMKDVSEQRVRDMIQFLLQEQHLSLSEGEYPVLSLGPLASEILSERKPLSAQLALEQAPQGKKASRSRNAKERPGAEAQGDGGSAHPVLLKRLRALRTELAASQKVPAYVVFSNATLEGLCARLPKTPLELLDVPGIGEHKLGLYGDQILEEISAYLKKG